MSWEIRAASPRRWLPSGKDDRRKEEQVEATDLAQPWKRTETTGALIHHEQGAYRSSKVSLILLKI